MAPSAGYIAWAQKYNTKKVFWADLTVKKLADGSPVVLHWATRSGEWVAGYYYDGCISSIPKITHRAQNVVYGSSLASFTTLEVETQEGIVVDPTTSLTIDDLVSEYLFEGGEIIIYSGGPELTDTPATVLKGVMVGVSYDEETLTIKITSPQETVAKKSLPPNEYGDSCFAAWTAGVPIYAGELRSPTTGNGFYYQANGAGTTGITEPTWPTTNGSTVSDNGITWTCRVLPDGVEGQSIPIPYGWRFNVPVRLIHDGTWLYQFGDPAYGPYEAVSAVYVNGKAVSMPTVNLNAGTIKFPSDPQGTVTADIKGRKVGGVFIDKPGDIVRDILTNIGGVPVGDIGPTFDSYNLAVPYPIGHLFEHKSTIETGIDDLLKSLLTVWGVARSGEWFIKLFTPPSGAPDLTLTTREIEKIRVAHDDLIIWKISIGADRNHSPTSSPAETTPQARKAWLKEAYRFAIKSDSAIKTLYGDAAQESGPNDSALKLVTDGKIICEWWISAYGQLRKTITIEAELVLLTLELLDQLMVIHNRFNFSGGVLGRVVEIRENPNNSVIELDIWV